MTDIARDVDVLVVGGGNAGCCAALAAARHGARTLLVERYGFLGGTATAAMVGPWMTFHSGSERIIGGIAHEIVQRLIERGASPGHIHDSSAYVGTITPFDPESHKALLFSMMDEARVDLLLHAYFVGCTLGDDGWVLSFATVAGIIALQARTVIDATADAAVAFAAGAGVLVGDARGQVQPATLMFRLGDVDLEQTAAYLSVHPDEFRSDLAVEEITAANLSAVAGFTRELAAARARGDVSAPREIVSFFATPYRNEVTVNMTRVVDVNPLDPFDLTRAEIIARRQVDELVRFFRQDIPGFSHARLTATASQVGIRESRRIIGRYVLTAQDVLEARRFDDAVARSAYPIDLHNPNGSGTVTHRLAPGTAYEIPYRCLVPISTADMLVAGRCISTTHEAHASTRLTPTVMTLGEAAGTAAAIAHRENISVSNLDTHILRETLTAAGVDLRRNR